jgi:signal transduction histidine kinase
MGSFDELNQVILNMIVNAAHAIDDARTRRGDSALGLIHISTTLLSDQSIELRISDNGQGIPEEIRSRIFDPFFTTKEVGKGTGQGLAICRSVVTKNHGGSVSFETEVGKGTTFIIQLPIGNPVGDDHDTAPAPSGQGA